MSAKVHCEEEHHFIVDHVTVGINHVTLTLNHFWYETLAQFLFLWYRFISYYVLQHLTQYIHPRASNKGIVLRYKALIYLMYPIALSYVSFVPLSLAVVLADSFPPLADSFPPLAVSFPPLAVSFPPLGYQACFVPCNLYT